MKMHEIRQLKKNNQANITEALTNVSQLKVKERYFVTCARNGLVSRCTRCREASDPTCRL